MSDDARPDTPKPYRLVGEETPAWPVGAFILLGVLCSVAAAWLLMTHGVQAPGQATPVSVNARDRPAPPPPTVAESPRIEPPAKPDSAASKPEDAGAEKPSEAITPATMPTVATVDEQPTETGALDAATLKPEDSGAEKPAEATDPAAPTVAKVEEQPTSIDTRDTAILKPDDTGAEKPAEATAPAAPTVAGTTPAPLAVKHCPPALVVMFKRGSAQPKSPDLALTIAQLRDWLSNHADARLIIQGFTDATGAEAYNIVLSYRRAKAIAAMLADAGIERKRIVLHAVGAQQLLEGLPPHSDRNRRVSVLVEGATECPVTLTAGIAP